jgi:hypothetical protein
MSGYALQRKQVSSAFPRYDPFRYHYGPPAGNKCIRSILTALVSYDTVVPDLATIFQGERGYAGLCASRQ